MSNISCVMPCLTCLPFIGPWIAFHKSHALSHQISKITDSFTLFSLKNKANFTAANIGYYLVNEQGAKVGVGKKAMMPGLRQDLIAKTTQYKKEAIDLTKERISYSICSLIGNILSIASLVALVATGILNPGLSICIAGCAFLLGAYFAKRSINEYKQSLQQLQNIPIPAPYIAGQPA